VVVALGGYLVVLGVSSRAQTDYYGYFEELAKVIEQIEANYVEEVDQQALFQGAIEGMLRKLDPYSAYIPGQMYRIFQEDTRGSFGGLGITITLEDDQLTVISPLEDSPAAHAGILPGDKIVRIEGDSTDGISLFDAVTRLRGKAGSDVTITVRHRGSEEEVDVTITREIIQIHSVKGYRRVGEGQGWDYWVNPEEKIAYIRLAAFQENTVAELDEVMEKLDQEDIIGLVLDLRWNPGGLLSSAVAVADRFLSDGVIVSIRGRRIATKEERAQDTNDDYRSDLLVALLVNRYSASGSEIVAGALQDHSRATVIGEETFGKGSVQNVIPLSDGASAIKLTTARYCTPSGRSFHRDFRTKKGGLVPDIAIRQSTAEVGRLYQHYQRLAVAPETEPEPPATAEKGAEPLVDAQLQRAVDLLIGLNVVRSAIR
jgi:carboxyl-terminal processing protease